MVSRLKSPLPYVEDIIVFRRGNCNSRKSTAGRKVSDIAGITSNGILYNDMKSAVVNATNKAAIEMKRVHKPHINFLGSDIRKSSKEYRAVRMLRNIRTEVQDAKKERVSAIMKIIKRSSRIWIGSPEVSLVPPGTVKMAWKVTVAMRAATKLFAAAVSHLSMRVFEYLVPCSLFPAHKLKTNIVFVILVSINEI